jgi:hypothetical protein
LKKIAQTVAQSILCQNDCITFTLEESCDKIWPSEEFAHVEKDNNAYGKQSSQRA